MARFPAPPRRPRPAAAAPSPRRGAPALTALLAAAALLAASPGAIGAQDATGEAPPDPRARELGVPLEGRPGPLDAITDVPGVEVGHATVVRGEGRLVPGEGPVRTGVTAVFPRGRTGDDTVFAAVHDLNANGEMTGAVWIDESGVLQGPVLLTNTHSVGVVRDAVLRWMLGNRPGFMWGLPVVAEVWDGGLNDINGFHVRPEHAFRAMDSARGGSVPEGNVGGGTGGICHDFKGGIGTASRRLPDAEGGYTVGVLVQCNYGLRRRLRVAGVPVGRLIDAPMPCIAADREPSRPWMRGVPFCEGFGPGEEGDAAGGEPTSPARGSRGISRRSPAPDSGPGPGGRALDGGSIVVVVATDAPLIPVQLRRLAERAGLGIARMGGIGANSSGDLFLAFSTANAGAAGRADSARATVLANERLSPLFEAAVRATEESILNALLAAETMTGVDGYRVPELPEEELMEILDRWRREPPRVP